MPYLVEVVIKFQSAFKPENVQFCPFIAKNHDIKNEKMGQKLNVP